LPELRKDPVNGRWVVIAPERSRRPSNFVRRPVVAAGDPECPFCEGHENRTPPEILAIRDHNAPNQPGWRLRVVPNRYPALRIEGDLDRHGEGLYDQMNGVGAHEVIIECPEHEISLACLPEKRAEDLFWAFRERIVDLKRDTRLRYILVFKNHGETGGATLEHSHSQLIALPFVPGFVADELQGSLRHFQTRDRCLFCDIIRQELDTRKRVVMENEDVIAIAPYASRFPFETWVLPRRHASHFESAPGHTLQRLAQMVQTVLKKLDRALEHPAYNFVLHTAPLQESPLDHYHWHLEIVPRVTRVAGFEWGTGCYVNPTAPEDAAKFLREL
jgi:UDPglucose--hexose-1-phosphate uridylyltransferase